LPFEKIRIGYKSDEYFNRSKYIFKQDNHHKKVTMQFFQKVPDSVVCGVDQTLAVIAMGTGYFSNPLEASKLFKQLLVLEQKEHDLRHAEVLTSQHQRIENYKQLDSVRCRMRDLWVNCFEDLEIEALYDGEIVGAREPVILVRGDLMTFVHLENLLTGALTDGTMVATNTRDVVEAANGKPILMFGARHQVAESQAGSGYAAYIGGAKGVSTDEQGEYWGSKGVGTIPHALIAAYDGDTVKATQKFDQYIDPSVVRVSLVDFHNDSVKTSLEVARALGDRLGGVRLDTSENMIDVCLKDDYENGLIAENDARGVNPELVLRVRRALDLEGFSNVGIFVSGGFNPDKIRRFEEMQLPVVGYGVGSALFDRRGGKFEYTADVVEPVAKAGRGLWSGPKLHRVNPREIL
jgi:nicotinate phosphoribosyltransferase